MANKTDLVKEKPSVRQVSQDQIEEFVEREKLIYLGECSALSDINVKESIEALMASVHEVQQDVEQQRVKDSLKLS